VGPSSSALQTLTVNGNASYLSSIGLISSRSIGDYTLAATVSGFGLAAPTGSVSFLNTTGGNQSVGSAVIDPSTIVSSYIAGTNSPLTNTNIEHVATGDFNGDGIADIATANTDGTVKVQIDLGNSSFQSAVSYAVSSNLNVIRIADVNGDGKADLIVISSNDGTVSILLGNGNDTFQAPSGSHILTAGSSPDYMAVSDLNNDGNPDIIVINQNDSNAGIFLETATAPSKVSRSTQLAAAQIVLQSPISTKTVTPISLLPISTTAPSASCWVTAMAHSRPRLL
jgi:hypothetical protein